MLRVSFLLMAMVAMVFGGGVRPTAIPAQLNFNVPQQLQVGDQIELHLQLTQNAKR